MFQGLGKNVRGRSLFYIAAGWLLLESAGTAGQWPQFRGPDGQGHADPIPLKWGENEQGEAENIVWKKPLPGLAWSSPVIADGRIYLTTAVDRTPEDSSKAEDRKVELGAMCLDSKTGDVIWQKTLFLQVGEVEIHKKNSHASPTPIVDGDALYVHFGPHGTARLTLDGETVWTRKLEYAPMHGNGGTPALAGDVLVISCDGHDVRYGVGLETATGEIRWKKERSIPSKNAFSFGTPLVIEVNGKTQAICPASEAVYAYDPATGEEIWRVGYPKGYSVTPRPVYGKGLVFICTGYMKPSLIAIDPTGTGDITETHVRWRTERNVPHTPSVLLVEDRLFFVSDKGIARCVEAETGENLWQERLGGNYSASPTYSDGRVYFQNEEGEAVVVPASGEFEILARNRVTRDERTFASYAVSDGALFLRSEHHLFRIQENGSENRK